MDIDLPFPIEYVERTPPGEVMAKVFFDGMEKWGGRALVGWWLALWLMVLRWILGLVFNLGYIGEEERRKKVD